MSKGSQAYFEGVKAAKDCLYSPKCDYSPGSEEARDWWHGYYSLKGIPWENMSVGQRVTYKGQRYHLLYFADEDTVAISKTFGAEPILVPQEELSNEAFENGRQLGRFLLFQIRNKRR